MLDCKLFKLHCKGFILSLKLLHLTDLLKNRAAVDSALFVEKLDAVFEQGVFFLECGYLLFELGLFFSEFHVFETHTMHCLFAHLFSRF